ncbi:MAG: Rne/Rng family ribonuclease [Alphaproteobacteria bacterium]|nr:Rne/Rng family ribonuclease [Alphaproteobacteria bacterium]
MGKKMLIDAAHSEESRVAILNQDKLEEFDFETSTKRQLKGNVYLAKIIRIEPSLQAAFVEFGGNRHGFLAFNEIHPDYYRIPIEDREALLAAEREVAEPIDEVDETPAEDSDVETMGGEDVEEIQARPPRSRPSRQYKIQEVIKRRQIMLVQVAKEERGGKGAALTTYLSLPGRYCVLMPNAAKGGGISRKITNVADRKRLREIIESIELPESMSLIIRTAGMARSKIEIKRDCDYLMRFWNDIREKTLHSIAPALIYEEGDLIKRALRDYYTREIDEVLIEGEEGYKEAKEFIRKLMPSHVKKIIEYKDEKIPLFNRYGVEKQIDAMHSPIVQLKSGGYIVFGTTEALVAIDVNSGRATRERHIEETAFKTNLEAAEEVARQLRLRDLAGLVVIDFIDMEEDRNNEAVERRLKDAMRHDRARVQVGKMSPFGLLELSRQRLRPNIIESTSLPCVACHGSGMVRSVESSSLHILRGIEEEALQQKASALAVYVPTSIALYILNYKRNVLQNIENKWSVSVQFSKDDTLIPPEFRIERLQLRKDAAARESVREERIPEAPSNAPRPPERRTHAKRPQKFEPKPTEQIKQIPEEAVPLQEPSTSEKDGTNKPRRRFRKYDRRHRSKQGQPPAETTSIVSSSSLEKETTPASIKMDLPKKNNDNVEVRATNSAEKESQPTPPKKASTRKGWWQKLLD